MRARVWGGIVLVGVIGLSACTGGSDDESTAPSGTTIAADDDGTTPPKVSPKTLDGACSLLVGPAATYVDDTLSVGADVVKSDDALADHDRATAVQNRMFQVTAEGPERLQDATGQLVDYLDDPAAYVTDGKIDPLITDAVTEIEKICKA